MSTKVTAASDLKSKLLDRFAKVIEGVLECYDRLILTGLLVELGHPEAMSAQLSRLNIRCIDLGVFAEPLRDRANDNALLLARRAVLVGLKLNEHLIVPGLAMASAYMLRFLRRIFPPSK